MVFTLSDFKDDYIPEEDYIEREDELAFAHALNGALCGDTEYQCILGYIYSNAGHGVKVNLDKAEYWYLLAAEGGSQRAQCGLGEIYSAKHDYEKAVYRFEKAAEKGNYLAADKLAEHYFYGKGVKPDMERARKYAKKGAEGHYPASRDILKLIEGEGE